MTHLVTGGHGFLGWHLRVRLQAEHQIRAVPLGRGSLGELERHLRGATSMPVVYHLAGVNRADSDDEVERGNVELAEHAAKGVLAAGVPVRLVYANSTQSRQENPYGRSKAAAGEILHAAIQTVGGSFADVVLPNLFGEHGRPAYNSFVATFCEQVSRGASPTVTGDRELRLLHAQRASEELIEAGRGSVDDLREPVGEVKSVSDVLESLNRFHRQYSLGHVPSLLSAFEIDLFNTYRSFLFPRMFPFPLVPSRDARGELFETVRVHGGTGQTFVSRTNPGFTRGEHFHLRKIERFCVIEGEGEIALRRLLHEDVVRFRVSGTEPAFVDMPTMWVHNITNVGSGPLITQFWTDQLLNPEAPDTYWEPVARQESP